MSKVMTDQIRISFPDGSSREFPRGITVAEVAAAIGPRLAKAAVAATVGEGRVDLGYRIEADAPVSMITLDSPEGVEIYRHSISHVMAQAVKRLFPEVKFAIGPAIENGFYYDFDLPVPLAPGDLPRIEAEMARIVKEALPFKRLEMKKEEALKFFREAGQKYKVELIEALPGEKVSLYQQGDFIDLCLGPHLPSTDRIKAFKLQSIAGAYWRGDSQREMLQRIYGVAFPTQAELDNYLHMLEEAAKRDHRKLGKELDLFSLMDEGPGFPFFHPKGMILRNTLEDFWREEHRKRGYQEVKTPIILNEKLWRQSGHWDHYKENMYFTRIDDEDYAVKPMNCPGGMLLYKREIHSYRDLPLRVAELGLVHRHELSGALHGLMRVRCFTQDDAHIFMLPSQIRSEIEGVIDLADHIYRVFGFEYHVELSTKPENAMGSDEIWEKATASLQEALEGKKMDYRVNEGDGAFYGPKIDFHLRDCLGRTWQCGTIQLDFLMPERFDLTYVGEDGEKHRPVMLHRTIFGSMERFIGILIEHYAGAFPTWLSPVQVKVISVGEAHLPYAREVQKLLDDHRVRVERDERNEKLGYKIREAQMARIPYMLVIGDKEVETASVAVRSRDRGDLGTMPAVDFLNKVTGEIAGKK
ncbi:MAG: threonine--tRNA ligase [Firmicutes bacterium]|nr:threonine--tRNA ligase [Bacillota bacterium]